MRVTKITLNPELLTALFALLRRRGFIARQRAACCRTCAGYEIASEPKNHGRKLVFTTHQDYPLGEGVYLKYGVVVNSEREEAEGAFPDEPGMRRYIGEEVADIAESMGLTVRWDGKPETCIWVGGPEPVPEATWVDLVSAPVRPRGGWREFVADLPH